MTSVPNIVARLTLLETLTTEATVLSSASTYYICNTDAKYYNIGIKCDVSVSIRRSLSTKKKIPLA